MLHILVHIISISNFAYCIYWEMFILQDPRDKPGSPRAYAGQWKFLTFWNLWIQLIYFVISLLNSIFGTHASDKKSASTLQKMCDFLFATLGYFHLLLRIIRFDVIWKIDFCFQLLYIQSKLVSLMNSSITPFMFD